MTVVIPTGARVIEIDLDTAETNIFKNVPYNTNEMFYSTDSGMAFLKFTGATQDYTGCTARLTLINFNDGSKVQRTFEMDTTTTFVYPMLETELAHAGRWIGQIAVIKNGTTISDNPFRFKIDGTILTTALISFDNINTFTSQLTTIYDGLNTFLDVVILDESGRADTEGLRVVAEGLRVTADALRETKEGIRQSTFEANEIVRDGLVNTLIASGTIEQAVIQEVAEQYQLIESTQAPRLLSVEQQLEQTETNISKKVGDGILAEMGDLSQTVKESMTGGSVAVVGVGAVTMANLANDVLAEIEIPISNGVSNPDFTGTTSWTGGGATIAAVDNALSITATGASFDPRVQQNATTIPYVAGHKYYIKGKFKPMTANVKALRIWLYCFGMTSIYVEKTDFVLNEWNDFSTIITAGTGGSGYIGLWYSFNQTALIAQKEGELMEMFADDLSTSFGVGKEPTVETVNTILSYYPSNWFKSKATLSKSVEYLTNEKADKNELLPLSVEIAKAVKNREVGSNSVCITFDGSWDSPVLSGAIAELEAMGGQATFFPNTTTLNTVGYLTSAQLIALKDAGHEIGVYGSTASTNMLTGMTNAEVDTMLRARQADIKAIIGSNPRTMAYPQGSASVNTHRVASRYFDRVRMTNKLWLMDKNCFVGFGHPSVVDATVNDTIDAIKYCAKNGKDIILTFHTIQSTGGITFDNFKLILQAIKDSKMRVETMRKVIDRYNMVNDNWYDYTIDTTFNGIGWVANTLSGITYQEEVGQGMWGGTALTISNSTGAGGYVDDRIMLDLNYADYYFSLPYKLTGRTAGSIVVSVRYADSADTYLSAQTITISADTDWTIGRLVLVKPVDAVSATVRLQVVSLNVEAKAYFDRAVLTPKFAGDFTLDPV